MVRNIKKNKQTQKHESTIKSNEESPILIYPNEVKNRIVFKIKTGYKLQLLTKETQKLLGDGPLTDKNKNSKNISQLDKVEYVLLHCNLVATLLIIYKILNFYTNLFQIKNLDS